jgi:hypothetical protein
MMAGGVYISNVTVTLTAKDGSTGSLTLVEQVLERLGFLVDTSGVNYTMYKINDGDWTIYGDPFIIDEDGTYTISYYSVDNAGNVETIRDATLTIEKDWTPPVTTHTFSGVTGENNWYISDVIVTLTATDNAAGVDFTMYNLDDSDWTKYTNPIHVTEDGLHTLVYFSVDKLGNKEEDKGPFDLGIDQIAPEITLTVKQIGLLSKWLLTANVSDETSGVAKVEFYVDDEFVGEVTEAPYELEYSGTGDTAQAIVYDNAGNNAISNEVKDVEVSVSQSSQSTSQTQSTPSSSQTQTSISTLQQLLFGLR